MRIVQLDQSGPDWHRWRAGGLGGSEAASIMRECPYQTAEEVRDTKLGRRKIFENSAMARGKRLEPLARELYQRLTGIRVRPVCVEHDKYPWMKASLDGLSEDGNIILEIKCPVRPGGHYTALAGQVPAHYRAQVQHQLAVTGCPVLHFFSFTDKKEFEPYEQFALVRVLPDKEYIERLIEREKEFWEQLQEQRAEAYS